MTKSSEMEERGGHQALPSSWPWETPLDDPLERQMEIKSCADTAPFVPRSTSIASEMLGWRSSRSARVSVLGERPMRMANADSVSPLRFRNDCSVSMTSMLPNRQKKVNRNFAYLALATICQTGKMRR